MTRAQVGQSPIAYPGKETLPAQAGRRPVAAQSAALQLTQGEHWFCVQTLPRKEPTALVNLHRQGFRTFMPRLLKTVRHARKTRTVRAPLFPGYLFTPLDLDRDQWRRINGSFGVASLVMEGDRPRLVPVGIVESLQALVGDGDLVDLGVCLAVGGPVRILAGPFADQLGQLSGLDDHGRARVLLEIMGAERTVTIESRSLVAAA